jgi:hypothetical protein
VGGIRGLAPAAHLALAQVHALHPVPAHPEPRARARRAARRRPLPERRARPCPGAREPLARAHAPAPAPRAPKRRLVQARLRERPARHRRDGPRCATTTVRPDRDNRHRSVDQRSGISAWLEDSMSYAVATLRRSPSTSSWREYAKQSSSAWRSRGSHRNDSSSSAYRGFGSENEPVAQFHGQAARRCSGAPGVRRDPHSRQPPLQSGSSRAGSRGRDGGSANRTRAQHALSKSKGAGHRLREPRQPRRQLEQPRQERALGEPRQERARELPPRLHTGPIAAATPGQCTGQSATPMHVMLEDPHPVPGRPPVRPKSAGPPELVGRASRALRRALPSKEPGLAHRARIRDRALWDSAPTPLQCAAP